MNKTKTEGLVVGGGVIGDKNKLKNESQFKRTGEKFIPKTQLMAKT